jgi:hypothetical protein
MNGTLASKNQRRAAVERLYLKGYRPAKIHEIVNAKFPCVVGTVRNDVSAIRRAWKSNGEDVESYGRYGDEYVERSRHFQRLALEKGDVATAYKIERDIASLLGVDFVSPIIRLGERAVADIESDQIEAELARLDIIMGTAEVPNDD